MSEGKPAVYTWTVTTGYGNSRFTVEACASRVEATGHMVLYGPDREPVFTAEPGQGCTVQRRPRAEAPPGEPAATNPAGDRVTAPGTPAPAPVGFAEFEESWANACADAWDDGQRRPAVLLPDFMWPGIASMINPVTREPVTVMRVRTFPVQNGPGDVDHWTSETVERVTHTATGKSAEAPTRDAAIGKLVRGLVEDGDISMNAARRIHGLEPVCMPEASQPGAGLLMKARQPAACCGEGLACSNCA